MEALSSSVKADKPLIPKTYVLLPAYNEAEALARLVPRISDALRKASRPFEIVVVNDGSADATSRVLASLAADHRVRELIHPHNLGYGAALRTAFLWVCQNAQPEDAAATLDADNTQDPAYLPRLLNRLEDGCEAVTASYTMVGGRAYGLPFSRQLMSTVLNRLFQLVFRLEGVETYTNGFRAYRVSTLRRVQEHYKDRLIVESGFPGGTEIFLKVVGSGGRVSEIPFELHYDQRGKASKIRLLSTIRRYLKLLLTGHRYVLS